MMAVDSKQNGTNGASANGSRTKSNRKRPSSLMAHASALPTVEHSLEEFIAKANQTLVDVSTWGNADAEAKAAEEARRQQDALRMKAAETQLREGEARETSLRRQLDGLQGKLAEAEARAAVASTTAGSAANDAALQQLRDQIEMAEAQRKAADLEKQQLARQLKDAKEEVAVVRATTTMQAVSVPVEVDNSEALERIRIAEAKAAKALAAAKAAQAGLTVSDADLAAIESGLVVPHMPAKSGAPWALIAIAFVGGLGIMFAVWKFALSKDKAAANTPAQVQPATAPEPLAAPAAAPEARPTVTPIEEPAAKPTVEPIEEEPTAAVKEEPTAATDEAKAPDVMEEPATAKQEPKAEPVKAKAEPVKAKAEPVKAKAEPKKVVAPKVKKEVSAPKKEAPAPKKEAPKKETKPSVVDPFGETPAPKKVAPKKETKPAGGGGIVDPF
ncbi:MAG: hypothetical protein ACKV2T_03340 [Kofleriaceae bacterium]